MGFKAPYNSCDEDVCNNTLTSPKAPLISNIGGVVLMEQLISLTSNTLTMDLTDVMKKCGGCSVLESIQKYKNS